MKVVDSLAPVKEIRLKQRTEAWMTCDIMNLIQERDKLLYSFKKTKCPDTYKKFCSIKNKINREIKSAKSSYFSNKIEGRERMRGGKQRKFFREKRREKKSFI